MPIVLIGYFLVTKITPMRVYHLAFLAAASLIFYGYWDIHFIPIILCSILINYIFSIWIGNQSATERTRKILFVIAIICNLSALGFYKYINFGIDILNIVSHQKIASTSIILPLGISFFTFTQIAYLADVLSGHPKEKNFVKYVLFVTYFPHLIAGPILHHKEMMPQFSREENKRLSPEKMAIGLTVFTIGLFKKVIVADGFSLIANPIFSAVSKGMVTSADAFDGALAYTLQIYFDFSGYSDMAIGLSLIFGIVLPFNFDAPYKSRSIIEFWQRWHITLSRFLRDYLYITLGGNRCGSMRRYFNLMLTMVLGGLWHGAGFTYLAWGFLHGLYLTVNHWWRGILNLHPALNRFSKSFIYAIMSLLLTQFCVVIAWVYFRADSFVNANRMLKCMFTFHRGGDVKLTSHVTNIDFILIGLVYFVCIALPNINSIFEHWKIGLKTYQPTPSWNVISIKYNMSLCWAAAISVLFLLSMLFILIVGDGTQFLYFQF